MIRAVKLNAIESPPRSTNCDLAMEVLINGIDNSDLATVKYVIQKGGFHL